MQTLFVRNHSTVLSDLEVKAVLPAMSKQVTRDWAPIWGTKLAIKFLSLNVNKPIPLAWEAVILDDSDQAGALGYHDLTQDGSPLIKVFAKTDIQYGLTWTVTLSHEILETLGDPETARMYMLSTPDPQPKPIFFAYEVADPVEGEQYAYVINGVKVSNFVYPSWFQPNGSAPYDYLSKVTKPLEILQGGYQLVFDPQQGWRSIYASLAAPTTPSAPPALNRHYGIPSHRRVVRQKLERRLSER